MSLTTSRQKDDCCGCNCHHNQAFKLTNNSSNICENIYNNNNQNHQTKSSTPCQQYLTQLPPIGHNKSSGHTNKKAKIVIDNSSTLPTKRESIRMLYENKAVTENPLKSTLETHFFNINTTKRSQIHGINQ